MMQCLNCSKHVKPVKGFSRRWFFVLLVPAVLPAILYSAYHLARAPRKCPYCGWLNKRANTNAPRFLPGSQIYILRGDYQGQMGWIDAAEKRQQGSWLYTARLRNKARVNESVLAYGLEEKWLDFA